MGFHYEWLNDGMKVKVDGWNNQEGCNATVDVGGLIKEFKKLKEKDEKGEREFTDEDDNKYHLLEEYIELEDIEVE